MIKFYPVQKTEEDVFEAVQKVENGSGLTSHGIASQIHFSSLLGGDFATDGVDKDVVHWYSNEF